MNNWIRTMSVVAIMVLGLSLTGCLDNSGGKKPAKPAQPTQPSTPDSQETPKTTPVQPAGAAYNPNGNKSPSITVFNLPKLDVAAVDKGTKVELEAIGVDPEGSTVIIKYSATGGKIVVEAGKSYWVAPNVAGIYELRAVANDGILDSDPEIIQIKVNGSANGINVAPLSIKQKKSASIKKAITSNTSSTSKVILQVGETVDITLSYSSPNACAVAPELSNGSIVVKTWDTTGVDYSQVYTYTAPSTAPTGNTTTLTFNIQDQTTFANSATVAVTFIINTPPVITLAEFTTTPKTTIGPLGGATASTKTIQVTASDADTGDTLTYKFTKDPNYTASANGTLTTSGATTCDFTSAKYLGTGQIIVNVTDTRGGTAQYLFTFYVVDSFYAAIADKTANPSLEFTDVVDTDNVTVLPSYVTNKTLVDASQVTRPVATDSDNVVTYDSGPKAYWKNMPTTIGAGVTITDSPYWWSDKVGSKTLQASQVFADRKIQAPTYYTRYPGMHTLTARINDATGAYVEATGTLYVNEAPNITRVAMVGADGATITLFNNNAQSIIPDVSAGSSFAITATVADADNDRVTPAADATGYFSWTATKYRAVVPASAVGTRFATLGDDSAFASVAYTLPTSFSIASTSPTMTYALASNTPQGKRHLVIRTADGMDNVIDGSAYVIANDATTTAVTPNGSGISVVADDANSVVDPESFIVGYNPEKTNFAGNYYIYCTSSASNTWKIVDEATGAYIKDAAGADITQASFTGFLPAPYDWLYVFESGGVATNGTLADKHYFKTNSTQVVVELNVVDGPQITGLSYNKYVSAGASTDIVVSAKGRLYQSVNQNSTVTTTGASLGTLATGTDTVVNEVTNKVWRYTAPSSFTTGQYEDITLTVKDNGNATYKTSRTIRIYFNKAPTISSVTPGDTTKAATLDNKNYWIKKGTHGISLSTVASDQDQGDVLGYVWDLTTTNSGTLTFATASSALWEPFNGATALTATGGNSGKYPVQLMVYDKDNTGVAKGATALKSVEVGINEDPDVGLNLAGTANVDGILGAVATTSYDATLGSPWTAAGAVVDNGTIGNGLGTTTIDFNTAQYAGVKFLGKPNGVTDEADDRNALHYSYYLTESTPTGNMVSTETLASYIPLAGDPITAIPSKQLLWQPTDVIRKNGGDYWLHLLVTDDKPGVAKGRTEYTEKLSVTKDATAPSLDTSTAGYLKKNGVNLAAADAFVVGDKLQASIPQSAYKDLNGAIINIDEFIEGQTIAQTIAAETNDENRKEVSLVKNTQSTGTPTDDTWDLEYTIAKGTVTSLGAPRGNAGNGGVNFFDQATGELDVIFTATTGVKQGSLLYVDLINSGTAALHGQRVYFRVPQSAAVEMIDANGSARAGATGNSAIVGATGVGGTTWIAGAHGIYNEDGTAFGAVDITPAQVRGNVYLVNAIDDPTGEVNAKRAIGTDIAGNQQVTPYNDLRVVKVDNDPPVFGNERLTNTLGGQDMPLNEDNIRFDLKTFAYGTALAATGFTSPRVVDGVDNITSTVTTGLPDYDNVFNIGDQFRFAQLVGTTMTASVNGANAVTGATDRDSTLGSLDAANIGQGTLAMAAAGATNYFAKTPTTALLESASSTYATSFGADATPSISYYLQDTAGNKTYKTSQVLTKLNGATNEIKYYTLNNVFGAITFGINYDDVGVVGSGGHEIIGVGTLFTKFIDKGDIIYMEAYTGNTGTLGHFYSFTVISVLDDTHLEVTSNDSVAATGVAALAADQVTGRWARAYVQKANYTYQGFDLKRPSVTKVEVYSYDPNVTDPTASGYLPVADRTKLVAGVLDISTIADADYSANKIGDTITITATTGDFYTANFHVKKGMTFKLTNNRAIPNTNLMYVMANADATASDSTLSCTLISRVGVNINGVANAVLNHMYGTDMAAFNVIDSNTAGFTSANINDSNSETAEVMKITFDKPMFVGQDMGTFDNPRYLSGRTVAQVMADADDSDSNLGTTLNDVSMHVLTTDGTTSTDVSKGAAFATVTGADTAQLANLPNFAYVPSGVSASSSSVLYVVFANTGADTVNHLAKGTHFEVKFRDYTSGNNLDAGADVLDATNDVLKVVADQHGNLINATLNNQLSPHAGIAF